MSKVCVSRRREVETHIEDFETQNFFYVQNVFKVKKMKFCQITRNAEKNDFQAFLSDFIFENFGGSRAAPRLLATLKPVLIQASTSMIP